MTYIEMLKQLEAGDRAGGRNSRSNFAEWDAAYRELAAITYGITRDDARFQPVDSALDSCDRAWIARDWMAFQRSRASVHDAVMGISSSGTQG
jgi:hypothetical protein